MTGILLLDYPQYACDTQLPPVASLAPDLQKRKFFPMAVLLMHHLIQASLRMVAVQQIGKVVWWRGHN